MTADTTKEAHKAIAHDASAMVQQFPVDSLRDVSVHLNGDRATRSFSKPEQRVSQSDFGNRRPTRGTQR